MGGRALTPVAVARRLALAGLFAAPFGLSAVMPDPLPRWNRCALPEPAPPAGESIAFDLGVPDPSDCSATATVPRPEYEPATLRTIQVVVHVIMDSACSAGALTDAQVESQIEVMNEDFRAIAGTPGGGGTDAAIRFVLATSDPDDQPTTGITRDCNSTWFADGSPCAYCAALAWDPSRYLNLYTNSANGARGYVPFLPAAAGAQVGADVDRVVINSVAFGRPTTIPAHSGGRTVIHEVGHYLGLYHPYFNGCGVETPPDCYLTGDLICDTAPDAAAHDVCPIGATSCGGAPAPIDNYMELTDDSCLTHFMPEQVQRIRCTIQHYRPGLLGPQTIFRDGFESNDTTNWSAVAP